MKKRVFIIVLDSFGIGAAPDADRFGDAGSNTLGAIRDLPEFDCPNLRSLGLFDIDGVNGGGREKSGSSRGSYARLRELSLGKDTTIGHWELAGVISRSPLPTFPNGFDERLIGRLERETGRKVLCNKPYSGTEVIKDYGARHIATGDLIVYTSADSVLQIAAHEDVIPVAELYRICEIARKIADDYGIGRVIARPFVGEYPFTRTANRHDYSIAPPFTMLDAVCGGGKQVIAVGKINDIFAGRGITKSVRTKSNEEGMDRTIELLKADFEGLCFVNLVEFDSSFGHRNDAKGYARAMTAFDRRLSEVMSGLNDGDLLMITADHGCDPSTPSTDHSREYVPLLICGAGLKSVNLGTGHFSDVAATTLDYLDIDKGTLCGDSFLPLLKERT